MQSPFAHAARRPRDADGAVAVEFALIMPILFMIVFGIIEFGYMLNRDMIVGNASRDAARVASLNGTYAEICATVKNELSASGIPIPPGTSGQCETVLSATNPTEIKIDCRKVDDTACNATSTTYDTLAEPGATAIIRVRYDHSLITPGLAFLGDSVELQQSTQMRVE